MSQKKSAARATTPEAAKKSVGTDSVHLSESRRQFFGKFLTALIAVAEASGRDRVVNDLLAVKSRWLKRGRS
jgi:hypothetical protein